MSVAAIDLQTAWTNTFKTELKSHKLEPNL